MAAAVGAVAAAACGAECEFVAGTRPDDNHPVACIGAAGNGLAVEAELYAVGFTMLRGEPYGVVGGLFQHDFSAAGCDVSRHGAVAVQIHRRALCERMGGEKVGVGVDCAISAIAAVSAVLSALASRPHRAAGAGAAVFAVTAALTFFAVTTVLARSAGFSLEAARAALTGTAVFAGFPFRAGTAVLAGVTGFALGALRASGAGRAGSAVAAGFPFGAARAGMALFAVTAALAPRPLRTAGAGRAGFAADRNATLFPARGRVTVLLSVLFVCFVSIHIDVYPIFLN